MDYEQLLDDEIVDELQRLGGIDVGTPEYEKTLNGIVKLMEQSIKIKSERKANEENARKRKFEEDIARKQMEIDLKDRLIRNSIAVAGVVIPSIITVWGTLKTFKFEENGTVTSIIGRGFINKLLPRK